MRRARFVFLTKLFSRSENLELLTLPRARSALPRSGKTAKRSAAPYWGERRETTRNKHKAKHSAREWVKFLIIVIIYVYRMTINVKLGVTAEPEVRGSNANDQFSGMRE